MNTKNGHFDEQLAQACSQIVLCLVLGVSLKIALFCSKHYKKVLSAPPPGKGKEKTKIAQKLCLKQVQGCIENWSKHLAQHNWTFFKHMFLVIYFLFV